MGYSRKLGPPIVSATIATLALTSFSIVMLVGRDTHSSAQLFNAIWPIVLTSTVAVILVMSFLYRSLGDLVRTLEAREIAAQHQALHDQLTDLPNRALLEDRLTHALHRQHRGGEKLALLMLDLDRFKTVNDTLGHQAGDLLVQQVASRLTGMLREIDTVARIGGDEFAILLEDPRSERDVRMRGEAIIEALNESFILDDREARVGASIGAVFADEGDTASELLRKADITMYRAKASGRNCYHLFSDEMDETVQRKSHIEARLRSALGSRKGLALQYQPVIARNGTMTGVEGLLRWHDQELGIVSPAEVIPVAEECGLIDRLGDQLFEQACKVARAFPDLRVAINLSPAQFGDPGLAERLRSIAVHNGAFCEQFELEITENLFIQHSDLCGAIIEELRAMGFSIALDDFGTGYSSLGYLRSFKVDAVKLDRSFIETAQEENSIAIIRAAVTLGHAMELRVVAEGIADAQQQVVAMDAGCDELQGNLYAPAMPASELIEFAKIEKIDEFARSA